MASSRGSAIGDQGHLGALSAAEDVLYQQRRRRALLLVAAHATDADDCVELLAMLGLDDVLEERRPVPGPRPPLTTTGRSQFPDPTPDW